MHFLLNKESGKYSRCNKLNKIQISRTIFVGSYNMFYKCALKNVIQYNILVFV